MIRIKDPAKSLAFYRDVCGMSLVSERHFESGKFSLYFLATLPAGTDVPDPTSEDGYKFMKGLFNPVLELTHNHGTETDPAFSYHNGNDAPQGFGHVGFLVDDVDAAVAASEAAGCAIKKRSQDGKIKGIAFVVDPDGYWVELVKRGSRVPPVSE
mmetsp:Transcript_32548/g.70345  ORF Transcript_32548/g.70345 Transcript_32548/m.70345 type:complete len:155 (-) Transcript_32548:29-493(-)